MGSETTEKVGSGPRVTQFSVFLPNKVGALLDVVKMLNERGVDVLALAVQDSADTAIVRIVVSDPESVEDLFMEQGVPASICDLVVVELKEGASELGRLLAALLAAECNIFGSYALLTRPRGKAALALHVEDNDVAVAVLKQHRFSILGQSDISR
ncbi:MAG TPA: hypothetical protein VFG14_06150 [Chthoniobacteraceae bacterium]|jgi:hypothetical protein|nr:hypothetical protein [Chthoniobacteraceae bacterium]